MIGSAVLPRRSETGAWWLLLAVVLAIYFVVHWVAALAVLCFAVLQRARPLDFLASYLLVVAWGTFVDYMHGTLSRQLSLLSVGIVFTLFCYLMAYRTKAFILQRTPLTVCLLLYGGLTTLNFIRGVLVGNSARFAGLELLAMLALASSLLVANVRMDRRNVVAMLATLWLVGLGHTALGFYVFVLVHTRTGGVFFTAVPGLIAILIFNFALRGRTLRERWLPMLALLPLVTHQLLSFTRGYWLGLIAGVTWSVAVFGGWGDGARERWAQAGRLLAGLVLVAIVAGGLLSAVFDIPGLALGAWRRLSTSASTEYTSETASNIYRLIEYDRVLRDIQAAPWFGRGLGYTFVTRDPFFHKSLEQWFSHQNYLLVWLKQGLLGLAAFLAMLVAALSAGLRGRRLEEPWAAAWCAGTAAVTVQVMVFSNMHYPLAEVNSTFPVALMWGVTIALTSRDRWRLVWRSADGPIAAGAGT